VARPLEALTPDYQLLLDVRSFQIEKSSTGNLVAHVAFAAKILGDKGRIVASRTFDAQAPAHSAAAPDAVAALNDAFRQAATQLVEWTADAI
jgi:phospholipid/cholesterol/gamma-HCH transport system substrate-binding protein